MNSSTSSSRRFALAFAAVFGVSALVFVVGSEALVRNYVAPGHGLEERKRAFHASTAPAAAFGDSRVVSGIAGDAALANFADAGENLDSILGKVEAYVASGRAQRILLQAAPQHFAFYRLSADQSDRLEDFLDPAPGALQMLRPHFRRYLFEYWWAVLREPARLLKPRTSRAAAPPVESAIADMSAEAQRRQAMIRVQLHLPVRGFAATREMRRLRETVARATEAGIELCLVGFPVSAAYRTATESFPEFSKLRAYYDELARSLGAVRLDLWDAFDDRYFGNVDHLNGEGARRLSREARRGCFGEAA